MSVTAAQLLAIGNQPASNFPAYSPQYIYLTTLAYYTAQAAALTQQAQDAYNLAVANWQENKDNYPAYSVPYPTAPLISIPNAAAIAAWIAAPDYTGQTSFQPLIQIPAIVIPPDPPPAPALTIVPTAYSSSGLFSAAGDSPSIPVGTVITVTYNGALHTFRKTQYAIGSGPLGNPDYWQMIS